MYINVYINCSSNHRVEVTHKLNFQMIKMTIWIIYESDFRILEDVEKYDFWDLKYEWVQIQWRFFL